jgi:hypothetical protein
MNDKILSIADARKTFASKNRKTIALNGISFVVKARWHPLRFLINSLISNQ